MNLKIYDPTVAEKEKYFPLDLFSIIVVVFRNLNDLTALQHRLNGNDRELFKRSLIEILIVRLNAFFDEGYPRVSKIHATLGVRLDDEFKQLYRELEAGGRLNWVTKVRDAYLGHFPESFDSYQAHATEHEQLALLDELPKISAMLERVYTKVLEGLDADTKKAYFKVKNAMHLRIGFDFKNLSLSDSEIEKLRFQGVLE